MPALPPADWYADPFGRHERRYWDGTRWTEHVTSRGMQSVDPPVTRTPAGWYPDPFDRQERRYWNGEVWTEHVTSRGLQAADPPVTPIAGQPKKKVERQANRAGAYSGRPGGGSVFTEQVLVVNQTCWANFGDADLFFASFRGADHTGATMQGLV